MSNSASVTRLAWSIYRVGAPLVRRGGSGLLFGWVPTLFLGSIFGGILALLIRSTRKDVRRLQTDPEFAARLEREQERYFKTTGLAVPVVMGVMLVVLVVAAIAR